VPAVEDTAVVDGDDDDDGDLFDIV